VKLRNPLNGVKVIRCINEADHLDQFFAFKEQFHLTFFQITKPFAGLVMTVLT